MTAKVIAFPGRGRASSTVSADTCDLHEALWMAAFLIRDWEEFAYQVGSGGVVLVDAEGQPDPEPFGVEPAVIFAGTRYTVTEIVGMGKAIEPLRDLPAHMLVFFAIWNAEDHENAVTTYGDAIEMMEGALTSIEWEREQASNLRT